MYRVIFSIVTDQDIIKNGCYDPIEGNSEYVKVFEFGNDVDAVKKFVELKHFTKHMSYMYSTNFDERFLGFIARGVAGLNVAVYIEKWYDFDRHIELDIVTGIGEHQKHHSTVDELCEDFRAYLTREYGPIPENKYVCWRIDMDGVIAYGLNDLAYLTDFTMLYKDVCIFGKAQ